VLRSAGVLHRTPSIGLDRWQAQACGGSRPPLACGSIPSAWSPWAKGPGARDQGAAGIGTVRRGGKLRSQVSSICNCSGTLLAPAAHLVRAPEALQFLAMQVRHGARPGPWGSAATIIARPAARPAPLRRLLAGSPGSGLTAVSIAAAIRLVHRLGLMPSDKQRDFPAVSPAIRCSPLLVARIRASRLGLAILVSPFRWQHSAARRRPLIGLEELV